MLVPSMLLVRSAVPSSPNVEVTEAGWRKRDRRKRAAGEGGAPREVGHLVVGRAGNFGVGGDELLSLSGGDKGGGGVFGRVQGGFLLCVRDASAELASERGAHDHRENAPASRLTRY